MRPGGRPLGPVAQVFHIPQVPGASLISSLNGGRSLRSLAYAPFGAAARSRASGPAARPSLHGSLLVGCRARELNHFPQAAGACSARLPTRRYARGARSRRSELLRSSVPLTWRRLLVGCRACATRTMVRWRAQAARASIAACKMKPKRHRQPRRSGVPRSSGCRRSLREAVDAAIADGATIDEITDLIRGEGGACSRSAVGRYTKNVRDLIRQQQETDRGIEMWVRALGERARRPRGAHPGRDPADDDALHHGRTQPARGARDT